MAVGIMLPHQLLKKFALRPRQHKLLLALRGIGRADCMFFITEWLFDADLQRRAQIRLNKWEAHTP